MPFRILSLLLCLLIAGPMSTPAWALARPETRVGGSPVFASTFASADRDQTLEAHRESRGCGYDFASGVCKYLYAHNNPVNGIDPSGHEFSLSGLLVTSANIGRTAAQVGFAVAQAYNRATAAYDTIQDVALVAGILGDGEVDEEESEILIELLDDYVKARVQASALRVATGVGGKVLGAAAGAAGRLRISKMAIQKTREWYRNNKARYPDGSVTTPNGRYTVQVRNGFPDFSPYAQKTVTIKLSGSRSGDFDLADQAAGISKQWREQQNLVWHHHQKLGRMELVPKDLNNPASGGQWHAGGVKLFELLYDTTYGR